MDLMPGLLRLYVLEAFEVLGYESSDAEIRNYVRCRIDVPWDDLMLAIWTKGESTRWKEPN